MIMNYELDHFMMLLMGTILGVTSCMIYHSPPSGLECIEAAAVRGQAECVTYKKHVDP
jgi:hypothetical protein